MTQQSLIIRLKAVEGALEYSLQWAKSQHGLLAELGNPQTIEYLAKLEAALSDLRELIKEAEEQEQAGVHAGKPTYTALGEKP